MNQISEEDRIYYKIALSEAKKSLLENRVPIDVVLVKDGKIISSGHNQRVQKKQSNCTWGNGLYTKKQEGKQVTKI